MALISVGGGRSCAHSGAALVVHGCCCCYRTAATALQHHSHSAAAVYIAAASMLLWHCCVRGGRHATNRSGRVPPDCCKHDRVLLRCFCWLRPRPRRVGLRMRDSTDPAATRGTPVSGAVDSHPVQCVPALAPPPRTTTYPCAAFMHTVKKGGVLKPC